MQAFLLRSISPLEYGVSDIPLPQRDDGMVRIRIHAAALNHRDVWITKGQYAKIQLPVVLGSDGAGMIESIDDNQRGLSAGDHVFINPNINWGTNERAQSKEYSILGMPTNGTLSEFICVPEDRVHKIPTHLNLTQAAALPLAGLTAYRAVFTQGQCNGNDTVLITGIGGGVALMALQFAVAAGATVYVTSSSEEKITKACELGAAGGFLYTSPNWTKEAVQITGGFSLCIDSAGGEHLNNLVNATQPGGRIITYGATHGTVPDFDIRKVFWKQISVQGSTMGSDNDFMAMMRYVELHQIVPVIDSIVPFDKTVSAFERMSSMSQFGKIVIDLK